MTSYAHYVSILCIVLEVHTHFCLSYQLILSQFDIKKCLQQIWNSGVASFTTVNEEMKAF